MLASWKRIIFSTWCLIETVKAKKGKKLKTLDVSKNSDYYVHLNSVKENVEASENAKKESEENLSEIENKVSNL